LDEMTLFRMLDSFRQTQEQMDAYQFLLVIIVSLASSYLAVIFYRFFYESRGTGSQVHRSFPLLGISITTLFIGIQVSIPLSLGLLGALSIIRFRTPIKEPEEIGFIMLVIAASISSATLNFHYIVMLYLVAFISLLITRSAQMVKFLKRDGVLIITMSDETAESSMNKILEYLHSNLKWVRMESSSSRDGVTSIQLAFSGLNGEVTGFQHGLRKLAEIKTINVFLDRPGGIR